MGDCAPRWLFCCLLTLMCFALMQGQAAAAECSDIYPNAQVGPPPEWTFWADGSACFVRWVPETRDREDMLYAQCRDTLGARFVHFERDRGAGHSICVFKIVDTASAGKDGGGSEAAKSSQALRSTPSQKGDAANALIEAQILATRWHEKCVKKEAAEDSISAGMCWKAAAQAMEQLTTNGDFATQELEGKLEQLRSTWLKRAEQLEARHTESREDLRSVQPASYDDQLDPQDSAKPTNIKKRLKKQTSRKKSRRKIEVSSKERPPAQVQFQKPKSKKEAALKMTKNYTKKEEPRLERKKPKSAEDEKRPPLKCLLFSKLC
jgi:hypothetical protein